MRLEITLKSVSLGENGPLFKKLINSDGLAFTGQLENVMKRVTLGEPTNYPVLSGTYKFTQNPVGLSPRGFVVFAVITPIYVLHHLPSNSPILAVFCRV